ncbi:tetratricopeptide repeat protein, partial [Xanthomonas sp. WCS2017Noco2-62]|uniref:tetratricopeptide repeat protein n=1 Tax=Xanthomonas sp. WCS2017Noco2-62 TaxID=3073640 RepID=UPI00288A43A0
IAQEINVEETLANVKREVEKENYDKALALIEPLRAKFPQDEDIQTYTARIYSWKKEYKTAIKILSPMTDRF